MPEAIKHPIILLKNQPISNLLQHIHKQVGRPGCNHVLSAIRINLLDH